MSLVLESKAGGDFKPHVEGIHPAVCVDVIDLGLVETVFQGESRDEKEDSNDGRCIEEPLTPSPLPIGWGEGFFSPGGYPGWRPGGLTPGYSLEPRWGSKVRPTYVGDRRNDGFEPKGG